MLGSENGWKASFMKTSAAARVGPGRISGFKMFQLYLKQNVKQFWNSFSGISSCFAAKDAL